jgi:hypothetical protein
MSVAISSIAVLRPVELALKPSLVVVYNAFNNICTNQLKV